jgi:hypothetical protein
MEQITLRNVPIDLARRLTALKRERGTSLNALVLEILERALGVAPRRARLRRYATWTPDEAAEFADALSAQRGVEAEAWR